MATLELMYLSTEKKHQIKNAAFGEVLSHSYRAMFINL